MNHTFRFAAVALAGLMMTACQGNSVPPKSIAMLTTPAAKTAVAGRDYTTLYTVDPHGSSGARVGVEAIRSDASAIIVSSPPGALGHLISQSQVGIQIGKTRTWLPTQTGSKPRQVVGAAAYGQSIAWLETESTDISYRDTKVFAADVGKRSPTLLGNAADSTKNALNPWPPGLTIIATDGVHAWWTMPYLAKSPRGWTARIMVRDIAGHEPLAMAVDKAYLPTATAGGVEYVRSNVVDPSMSAVRFEIRLLKDGADTLITSGTLVEGEHVSTMCASATFVAWAVQAPNPPATNPIEGAGHLHVMTLATKAQQVVTLEGSAGSLSCGSTFVAWGSGSGNGDPGQYVLDLPSSKIWKLGQAQGISLVLAAGNILAWALPPKSQEAAPWRVTKWHGPQDQPKFPVPEATP